MYYLYFCAFVQACDAVTNNFLIVPLPHNFCAYDNKQLDLTYIKKQHT